jgi:hypothetical protein
LAFWVSIKVKITDDQPIYCIRHLNISELEMKVPLAYRSARGINSCKEPSSSIVEREELKRSSIIILKNSGAPKRTAFPDNNGSA